jgi:hypothetical protein
MALCTSQAVGQESDLAKDLHNPLANLREVFVQFDVLPDSGPRDDTAWAASLEPVWPFRLGGGWNLVTYSIIPYVSLPVVTPDGSRTGGIGDATFFGYFVPPGEGKLLWGFGPAIVAPTHSSDVPGNDRWAAGPALIVGTQPGNWSIFGLFDNVWSVGGSGEPVNEFNFQYLVVRALRNDWFAIANWVVEADWEAASDDRWTVPVGAGFGRQFKVGGEQFQAYAQLGYNVVRPDEIGDWRFLAAITWVF